MILIINITELHFILTIQEEEFILLMFKYW